MASIGINNLTYNSATLYVAELNTTTTYASIYITCDGRTSPNLAKSTASSTSNGWNVTGLSGSTTYSVSSTITSAGGSKAYPSGSFTTPAAPSPPGSISSVTLTPSTGSASIYAAWSSASGATNYRAEIYLGSTFITSYSGTSTSTNFTGLSEYTTYRVKVYAQNANGNGTPNDNNYATTGDFTAPTLVYVGKSGLGALELSWDAYDNASGLRSSNRFRTYVGTAGGGSNTLIANGWTQSMNASWVADANGNPLVPNQYYWVGVRAYDNSGNESALMSQQIQYLVSRPNNWSWYTTKTAGSPINLTASEWNAFTERINEFRLYKGYSLYPFTTVYSGGSMLASQVNEARLGMQIMTSVPSAQVSGGIASASYLNSLRNSLNSIT